MLDMKATLQHEAGFTLIELVMVVVILGILAAVATPKMIDLVRESELAALRSIAGSLASSGNINYAACLSGHVDCRTIDNCNVAFDHLVDSVETEALKLKYEISSLPIGKGISVSCWLISRSDPQVKASFPLVGTVLTAS